MPDFKLRVWQRMRKKIIQTSTVEIQICLSLQTRHLFFYIALKNLIYTQKCGNYVKEVLKANITSLNTYISLTQGP